MHRQLVEHVQNPATEKLFPMCAQGKRREGKTILELALRRMMWQANLANHGRNAKQIAVRHVPVDTAMHTAQIPTYKTEIPALAGRSANQMTYLDAQMVTLPRWVRIVVRHAPVEPPGWRAGADISTRKEQENHIESVQQAHQCQPMPTRKDG
jgi:hypothetical protein